MCVGVCKCACMPCVLCILSVCSSASLCVCVSVRLCVCVSMCMSACVCECMCARLLLNMYVFPFEFKIRGKSKKFDLAKHTYVSQFHGDGMHENSYH